jgi:hypothetical protein
MFRKKFYRNKVFKKKVVKKLKEQLLICKWGWYDTLLYRCSL